MKPAQIERLRLLRFALERARHEAATHAKLAKLAKLGGTS